MNIDKVERERLIEAVGVNAASQIQELQYKIEQLEKYLDIVTIFETKGWHYQKAMRPPLEPLKGIE